MAARSGTLVLESRDAGICELQLNRPEKRNAITTAMYASLADALARAQEDDSVRVILLSGTGAGFTAGNDLNDFLHGPPLTADHPALRFLRLLPGIDKVLIAAVHGCTVGIGVTMLLHCDLVVAARSARLSMPFVRLGLVPEAGSSLLLPRLMGLQRAAELLFLGKTLDAEAACAAGLVNRVTDDDGLLAAARALAAEVAAQPAGALRATKRLLRAELAAPLAARIEAELRAFESQLQSPEFKNAVRAFLSHGEPRGRD